MYTGPDHIGQTFRSGCVGAGMIFFWGGGVWIFWAQVVIFRHIGLKFCMVTGDRLTEVLGPNLEGFGMGEEVF